MSLPTLKSIFEAITPENIKQIPAVQVCLDIFTDVLEENSELAKRIISMYDTEILSDDTEKVQEAKKRVKEGLYYYYINNLYYCLSNLTQNKVVIRALKKFGYDNTKLLNSPDENVSEEFLSAFRNYTQQVGTESAMQYIYTFARYLESGDQESDLSVLKGDSPFILHYEGILNTAIHSNIVKPLSHPIGFCYTFDTMFTIMLRDYFGIEITYTFKRIELINLSESRYIVFTQNSEDDVIERFLNEVNPLTDQLFTRDEISAQVQIIIKTPLDYQYWEESDHVYRLITFDDDYVLYTDGQTIWYGKYTDYIDGFKTFEQKLGEDWSLHTDITSDFRFLYYDEIKGIDKSLDISRIRDEDHHVGDSDAYADCRLNALNVSGDEYHYVSGFDESRSRVSDFDALGYLHEGSITFSQDYHGVLKVTDKIGHFKTFKVDKQGEIKFNTYDLRGDTYTCTFTDDNGQVYSYTATGLNRQPVITLEPPEVITYTETDHFGLRVTGYCPDATVRLTLTDANLDRQSADVQGNFSYTFDTSLMQSGAFTLKASVLVGVKLRNTEVITGDYLNLFDKTPAFLSTLKYHGFYAKTFTKSDILKPDMMVGINTTGDGQKIGLGVKGYVKPDYFTLDFLQEYALDDQDVLLQAVTDGYVPKAFSGLKVRGSLIEGNDYDHSTYLDLERELTFVHRGYELVKVSTADFLLADSTRYLNESLQADAFGTDFYLYTTDDRYLTATRHYLRTNERALDEIQTAVSLQSYQSFREMSTIRISNV